MLNNVVNSQNVTSINRNALLEHSFAPSISTQH